MGQVVFQFRYNHLLVRPSIDDHITTIVWFTELVEIHEVLHSYDSTEWLWYLRRQGLLPDEMNSIGTNIGCNNSDMMMVLF